MHPQDLIVSELEQLTLLRNSGLMTDKELKDVEKSMHEQDSAELYTSRIVPENYSLKVAEREADILLILSIVFLMIMGLVSLLAFLQFS